MISNKTYEDLKSLKGDKSFSELLNNLLFLNNTNKGSELKECLGSIKKDKEWKETKKTLKKGWKNWTKKYA